jgi:hypothetical protein
MTDKEKLADLLNSQPLYKKITVDVDFFNHPVDMEEMSFPFYCPVDKSNQTFRLKVEPEKPLRLTGSKIPYDHYKSSFETFDHAKSKYTFTQHYSATCQLCNRYTSHFLLQVETDKSIPVNKSQVANNEEPLQVIKKIGQFPPYQITPDQDLINFLNSEDQENYKKALICRSQNYGIGAFAYLRRIVENEIVRIIEDLSKIDRPETNKINDLLSDFKANHVMSNLIDGVYDYLPSSLKNLGNNPLKILYGQLSGGIHEFSEEECSVKAEQIDTVLKFTVKKINQENSEVKNAREAMKSLSL